LSRCAAFVPKRSYSPPGPCQSERDVREIQHDGRRVRACAHHRKMAQSGRLVLAGER
jgi:hypothetical protein